MEEEDAYAFFKARTGYPVNPFNPEELAGYMRALDAAIGAEIVGQERMRRDLLQLFQDVIVGSKKDMGVIALLGRRAPENRRSPSCWRSTASTIPARSCAST